MSILGLVYEVVGIITLGGILPPGIESDYNPYMRGQYLEALFLVRLICYGSLIPSSVIYNFYNLVLSHRNNSD